MSAFVVDVNVPIVANGHSPQANLDCVSACVGYLQILVQDGTVVLDDQMRILKQYLDYLRPTGQPGLGDAFMQWVWENRAVAAKCERVAVTPVGGSFREFPDDPALAGFDPSDRVYVAVALASTKQPEVLNAVDPDWWEHRDALRQNGVYIRFLCPQHVV